MFVVTSFDLLVQSVVESFVDCLSLSVLFQELSQDSNSLDPVGLD